MSRRAEVLSGGQLVDSKKDFYHIPVNEAPVGRKIRETVDSMFSDLRKMGFQVNRQSTIDYLLNPARLRETIRVTLKLPVTARYSSSDKQATLDLLSSAGIRPAKVEVYKNPSDAPEDKREYKVIMYFQIECIENIEENSAQV